VKDKLVIYGYGNPGRQDDGLGIALIEKLEEVEFDDVLLDANYQLNAEDALFLSEGKTAIFVDASLNCEEPFSFYEIEPDNEIGFTTHAMSPQSVLALCRELYRKDYRAYVLEIRGYEWAFIEELTAAAKSNLNVAFSFVCDLIKCFQEHSKFNEEEISLIDVVKNIEKENCNV